MLRNPLIQIKIVDILKDLGIEYKSAGPDNVKIKCLNPSHIERNPSMYVHKETGGIHCFGCQFRGSILTLLYKKGFNFEESKQYLKKFLIGGNSDNEVRDFLEKFINSRSNTDLTEGTKDIKIPGNRLLESHPYLESRGITSKEVQEWKIGIINDAISPEFRRFFGWIIIPIVQKGILRNYFMRDTFGSGKEYGPYGRNDLLFGIDKYSDISKKIYIVEGIFDAIFFMRTRNQCVAALSNNLLPDQLNLLKLYKEVVIVPDNDEMGEKLIRSAHRLIHSTKVSICFLPKNRKDAAECTIDELVESTYKEISINDYLLEKTYGTYPGKIIEPF
jgi:DNA primase